MKKLLLIPALAILIASCSKNDTTSDPASDLTIKTNMVVQSNWTITQYTDSGKNETSDYSGYKFKFNSDGTFVAVSAVATFNGTWVLALGSSKQDDSNSYSDDDNLNKLTISITGNKQMDHLSHKWLADKITGTEIWLRDDNAASNEVLRFGKQ
jgi:heat shock protein HslJ